MWLLGDIGTVWSWHRLTAHGDEALHISPRRPEYQPPVTLYAALTDSYKNAFF
jgi:hypothetical protein